MVKKKVSAKISKKKISKKKIVKKKTASVKKTKTSKNKKNLASSSNSHELIFKENENQLISLITKEFDKDIALKARTYIKSYSKIEESIITINDFLNYIENLDEDLFKLFKAYTSTLDPETSSSNDESEEEEKSTGVKSDDPVRMYLKEMGNVELLSREGEIAIAKRIESGLDKMMNSILECPASIDILKKWIDQVKHNQINLREIVDFDEYFN